MNVEVLKIVGQVAGIGGLALGVMLILFKEVIRKNIFPNLTKKQGFKIIKLLLIFVWSIAVLGIASWFFLELNKSNQNSDAMNNQPTEIKITGDKILFINKPTKDVVINNNYSDTLKE